MSSAIKYGMLQREITEKQPSGEAKKAGITLWDRLQARQGFMAYLPIIVAVILLFLGGSWEYFRVHAAVAYYACYALTFWHGGGGVNLYHPVAHCNFLPTATLAMPPFHAMPLEYPPLSLVLFSLPLFAPLHYYLYYTVVFAMLMALTIVFIYWLLLRYAPRGAGLAFAIYMVIGAWGIAVGRFDLVPAALTLICVIAAERKRWTYAYIALAFALLLKIYPLLLLPALFIAEQQDARRFYTPQQPLKLASLPGELWQTLRGISHWRWKNSIIFFAILLGVTGFFALLNFQGAVLSQLSYFANRPVQIESTGSPLLFLGAHFGYPVQIIPSFGSTNVVSRLDRRVVVPVPYKPGFIESVTARNVLLAFLTLAYLFNWWQVRSTRNRRLDGVRSSTVSEYGEEREDHHSTSAPVQPLR